jgi:hypothetical protein
VRHRLLAFYVWLFTVFLFGLPIMTSYVFVQQEARSGINIPLIQIMQSVEADLRAGVAFADILKAKQIDLSISQSPFITLYGLDRKVIGSSQYLSGRTLTLPTGVLDNSRSKGESRVTWQPTSDLRFASITDYVPTFGYVSVSESLREVEDRASESAWIAVLALILGSFASGLGIWWFSRRRVS